MTYGWAILIIVIVAVILYSMGIFNPSSSVTFTSSGFSPFTVSSSLCNNLGYKIAVLAGPIPNNANSITINKVFLTSATGANTTTAGYTLTNPVTLKSGQSTTIIIPNVACTAAKVHYSFSAKIQYSYTAGTLGLQTVNTTGTIAGTSISGKPSVLTSYEPITITNTQSSATPNPFQQMVNFTSSDNGWTSISTGNFGQNVEFFYYNGTVIPSWLESYNTTKGYAIWWIKIAEIPAASSETVYVGFAPTSTNLFNTVNDGEAPQIPCGSTPTSSCSNYAEYDDGANVFNYYENFAGTATPSGWVLSGVGIVQNNGVTVEQSTGVGTLLTSANTYGLDPNSILDFYGSITNTAVNSYTLGAGYMSGPGGLSGASTSDYGVGAGIIGGTPNNWYALSVTGGTQGNVNSGIQPSSKIVSVYWPNSSSATILFDYASPIDITAHIPSTTQQIGIGGNNQETQILIVQYMRLRAYPPNGVMPSVTFGSVA